MWFFGLLTLIKASGESTGGQFTLVEQWGRRGVTTPVHRQPADQETFYNLDGEVEFYLSDDAPQTASAGATHAFTIVSDTARFLNFTTPNHEAFFRAAGDPTQERTLPPDMPPDMPRVMEAAARYGVEILGPPPGGS